MSFMLRDEDAIELLADAVENGRTNATRILVTKVCVNPHAPRCAEALALAVTRGHTETASILEHAMSYRIPDRSRGPHVAIP
jgi:hypothetical protein